MVLQLKQLKQKGLLDILNPSIVVLGAGDWLYERSMNPYLPGPALGLQFAYPYICKKDGEIVVINGPDWCSMKDYYCFQKEYFPEGKREVQLTWKRFYIMSSYVPRILAANIMRYIVKFSGKNITSMELYDYIIQEMQNIIDCRKTKFVIIWMPYLKNQPVDKGLINAVAKKTNILLIDGNEAIRKYGVENKEYVRRHPSAKAYKAYSDLIVLKLRQSH